MYDYTLKSELTNGTIKVTTYQKVISILDMQNDIMHGAKLSEGGVPQVMSICQLLKQAATGINKISIYFNGDCIATV